MDKTDRQLFESAREGCVEAFEKLIAPYTSGVYSLMYKICGNGFEASNLSQDVFVSVFEALMTGNPDGSLAYSIYSVAAEICRKVVHKPEIIERDSPDKSNICQTCLAEKSV